MPHPNRVRVVSVSLLALALGLSGAAAAGRHSGAARTPVVLPVNKEASDESVEHAMAIAATRFLASLSPELRARAQLPFDDKAREDWHYVPRKRSGIEFAEMNAEQRRAARDLMRAALSSQGMNKVEQIMQLDSVLRDMEQEKGPRRDPLAYSICVFGFPPSEVEAADATDAKHDHAHAAPWGWKLEGHHISLNFTGVHEHTTTTPAFLGSNPGEVRQGDRAGLRVLAVEEELARELLASLTPDQRREAVLSGEVPKDILAVPGRDVSKVDQTGLTVSEMKASQRGIVDRLLHEYANNLQHELAQQELSRIESAGKDKIRFAWIGSDQRGQGHFYRLSGPTFVIEYDNTQNDANHVHTVWRDRERDFGHDLLREHLEHDHGAK